MDENQIKSTESEGAALPSRRGRNRKKERSEGDYLTRMIFTQLFICLVFTLIVFALSKWGGNSFEQLKNEYRNITSKDMTAGEIWETVKNTGGALFKDGKSEKTLGMGGDDREVYAPGETELLSPFMVSSVICNPVSGEISSRFGYRVNPISGIWSFHSGIDIAADMGDRIKAAYYGTVTDCGYNDEAGNYVILRHSRGLVTKYYHCSKILVSKGTVVRQGEAIALVGSTGNSTGPHLHFTMEIDSKKVNPAYALKINDDQVQ